MFINNENEEIEMTIVCPRVTKSIIKVIKMSHNLILSQIQYIVDENFKHHILRFKNMVYNEYNTGNIVI